MNDDPYILNSCKNDQIKPKQDYHAGWNKFFRAIKRVEDKRTTPSAQTKAILLDVNCWLLLFYGYEYYQKQSDSRIGYVILNDDINKEVNSNLFQTNVKRLFSIFYFDLKSFYEVWEYQHNIERLLYQVVQERFFLGNRFSDKPRYWKPQYELICTPSQYSLLPIPKLNIVLDGLLFPVIVSRNDGNYQVERLDITNFGTGDFITCNGKVIDCIRINDFWQTRSHLKQRLAFSFLVRSDYDESPMIVCNNMKDIENAWKLLRADSQNGILIRSLGEDLYQNYWMLLNKDSAFVAMYTKTGFSMGRNGHNKRGFVTLEGKHIGSLGYTHTALKKIMWLDDFDIQRFRQIVFQTPDMTIDNHILQENNKQDMNPEFDFGLFRLDNFDNLYED